jgi:hypothetical protein
VRASPRYRPREVSQTFTIPQAVRPNSMPVVVDSFCGLFGDLLLRHVAYWRVHQAFDLGQQKTEELSSHAYYAIALAARTIEGGFGVLPRRSR